MSPGGENLVQIGSFYYHHHVLGPHRHLLLTAMSDNHHRRRPSIRNNPWSVHLILPYLIVQVLFFLVWVFTQVFYVLSSTVFDEVPTNLLYGAPRLLHPSRLTSFTGHASSLYRSERSSWD